MRKALMRSDRLQRSLPFVGLFLLAMLCVVLALKKPAATISNGGNQEGQWRTPRKEEWLYLLFVRNTASGVRFVKAVVNGVNGLVLLPDQWQATTYQLNSVNMAEMNYTNNVISLPDWQQVLEPAGAVFLPAGGVRTIEGIFELGTCQTSSVGCEDSFELLFDADDIYLWADGHRGDSLSVRLVRDVE